MIVYKNVANNYDLKFYPTSIGSNCEIKMRKLTSELNFKLTVSNEDSIVEIQPGGYLTMSLVEKDYTGEFTKNIKAVIQAPIIKNSLGKISTNNSIELNKLNKNTYQIKFIFNQNYINEETDIFISFEIRREKQPDNAIYSKKPDLQHAYLKNCSIVGKSDEYGIGRVLIRFKFVKDFNIYPENIIKATYKTYIFLLVEKNHLN